MNTDFAKLGIVAIFRGLWMGAVTGAVALIAPPIAATAAIVAGALWGGSLLVSIIAAETDPGYDSEGNYYGSEPNAYQRLERRVIDFVQEDIPDFFYNLKEKREAKKNDQNNNVEKASEELKQELKDAITDTPTLSETSEPVKNEPKAEQEQQIDDQLTLKK